MLSLPDVVGHVDRRSSPAPAGAIMYTLVVTFWLPNQKVLTGFSRRVARDGLGRHVGQRLAGADRGAHGPLADRGAVVAHVALHHLLVVPAPASGMPNGQASTQFEQAMQRGFERRLHDAVLALLDGVGGADLRAGGVVAVHADVGRGGDGLRAVDEVEVDHRDAAMGVALLAGLEAGLAADAARRVDVEFACRTSARLGCSPSGGPAAFSIRQADTLNSGILLRGSSVRCVRRLALRSPGQWYGMKTVSGRMVRTTIACSVIAPRRVVTVTQSPSAIPCCSASRGWISSLRLGILIDQRADAPRLRAREILAHHAAGGQVDRELGVHRIAALAPLEAQEMRLAVGVEETAAFEQARRARDDRASGTARRRPSAGRSSRR